MRLGALLLALLVVAGCGSESKPDDVKRSPSYRSYVALGDSYTSAPGLRPVGHYPCGRSNRNYPHLLAARLKVSVLADVSCASARTLNLLEPQATILRTTERPQLDALKPDTDLVTIGLGLNNRAGSVLALRACLEASLKKLCRQFLALTSTQVRGLAKDIAGDVGLALDLIEEKAPDADIVLVGYPSLGEAPCAEWPVTAPAAHRIHELYVEVDRAYDAVAALHDVRYVSVIGPGRDHGICSRAPWMAGITNIPGRGARLHPLDTGQQAVADLVAEALED